MEKIDPDYKETVGEKSTINDAGFTIYSHKMFLYDIWLDNYGYLINGWWKFVGKFASYLFETLVRTNKFIMVGKLVKIWYFNSPRERTITQRI